MHKTAMENAGRFFSTYLKGRSVTIVDIGAQDVNGSLRQIAPPEAKYIGVDFIEGKGVDVVLEDPYTLPFEEGSLDAIVSSSCFEHSEFFWLLFLEIMRVLKPDGLFYLNVPSNGVFHRYPVDCWRFYPDSGVALRNWARRNGVDAELLESYTSDQAGGGWNDLVCIFVKEKGFADKYPERIIGTFADLRNGLAYPNLDKFISPAELPEDQRQRLFWRLRAKLSSGLGKG